MKAFILMLLKTVGSDILLMLLDSIVDMITERKDTSMNKDGEKIKDLVKHNYKLRTKL
ncbi:hypothetical protein PE36_00125 [Moritella sp. PE36]|uniref:hypothetical protein n=1 Tax=Moritella sp. PE36 TaxID=58051 RepID=UPI000156927A|nr:hypothetical protein [Moritella sp. PE36]EDM66156.1 hypothetical protein PE36_00125 [Moritella sp. PE36]